MCYIEVRMFKVVVLMLEGIKKDIVDFVDNYDVIEKELLVFFLCFLNLLVLGGLGIVVGMVISILFYNLVEIIDVIIVLVKNLEISINEIMEFFLGLDFLIGVMIMGIKGIKEAYEIGKGFILVKLIVKIEYL